MTDLLFQLYQLPDGRTLSYAEFGEPDGKPVFYFHGLSGSRLEPAVFDDETYAKAGIRLIAPDRPGMGGSDFQPGRGFCHWVADVVALAEKLQLGKFAVWGVSGGGGYVSACARLIPERLTSVVISSGAGQMNSPEARASLPFMNRLVWGLAGYSPSLLGLFLTLTKPRGLDNLSKVRQQMFRSMPPAEKAFFEKPGRLEAFIASGLESMRQGVRGITWDSHLYARPWDFRLEEICFPVHLFHGEADLNVPVAIARQVASAIPGCQATFYPGESHIPVIGNHLDEVLSILAA